MSGDSGAASEWAVCTGPRPAGGLQRCPPRNWLSCPLAALCGVGGAGSGGGDHSVGTAPCCDGLDAVLPGLFIASGQAAARYGDLAACGVTHVVNAAPSVELCWHKQHLVRGGTRRLWGGTRAEANQSTRSTCPLLRGAVEGVPHALGVAQPIPMLSTAPGRPPLASPLSVSAPPIRGCLPCECGHRPRVPTTPARLTRPRCRVRRHTPYRYRTTWWWTS